MTTKRISSKSKSALEKDVKESESKRYANISLTASTMSAVLSESFTKSIFPETGIADMASVLSERIVEVQAGDMQSIEAMLVGQAQALQTMFVTLGRMAANKTQLPQYTAFMNMALKAQSQSRATIQALIELKYPKQATFVKQANIAHGHQQVNNATDTGTCEHARKIDNQPNELLEANDGNQDMDFRAAQTTSRTDKAMATMEKKHWS
jgi:hypothetical protein